VGFLCDHYKPTNKSTYLVAIRQEQLYGREILQLMSYSLKCLLFSVSLIHLILGCQQILVNLARIKRLHLSFVSS
jgi:hypothetical protein